MICDHGWNGSFLPSESCGQLASQLPLFDWFGDGFLLIDWFAKLSLSTTHYGKAMWSGCLMRW
jgi:hypothetical protein